MTPPSDPRFPDPDVLLAHQDWLRALARRLVADPNDADDLSQEAWIVASRSPAPEPGAARSWLSTLLRNLERKLRRSGLRRQEHEARAAWMRAQRLEEMVQVDLEQRRLVDRLIELPELYRDVLLQRFWEGRTPSEIAAHSALPLATVKTRLRRGLALLRERYRERRDLGALALLAWRSRRRALRPVSGPGLRWAATLAAAAAVGLVASLALVPDGPARGGIPALAGGGELARSAPDALPELGVRRASAPVAEHEELLDGARGSEPGRVHGRVLDLSGAPVAGVDVQVFRRVGGEDVPTERVTTSGEDGAFEVLCPPTDVVLRAVDPDHAALVHAAVPGDGAPRGVVLVVGPRATLSGRVVDRARRPLEGVRLVFEASRAPRLELPLVMERSFDAEWFAFTGEDGRFTFQDVPDDPDATLRVERVGYQVGHVAVSRAEEAGELVLLRLTPRPALLLGEVVDADGRPLASAWVTTGRETVHTTERGWFQMDRRQMDGDGTLTVAAPGYLPRRVDPRATAELRDGLPWTRVELVERCGAVRGVVLDAAGRPLAGALVTRLTGTRFGPVPGDVPGATGSEDELVEDLIGSRERWGWARADDAGRFTLGGLLPGVDYDLRAFDPATLRAVRARAAAGEDVELLLEAGERTPVAGRVVDEDGNPVAGVRVYPGLVRRDADGRARRPRVYGDPVRTDGAGRFRFERLVVTDDTLFYLRGSGGRIPCHRTFGPREALEDLELVFEAEAYFELGSSPLWEAADQFAIVTPDGGQRLITHRSGLHYRRFGRVDLDPTPPPHTLSVGAGASTLILYSGGQEIGRWAKRLTAGELVVLDP